MRFGRLRGGARRPLTEEEAKALEQSLAEAIDDFRVRHPAATDPFARVEEESDYEPDHGFPAIDENAGPWHLPTARPAAAPEPPRPPAPPSAVFPAAVAPPPPDPEAIRRAVDIGLDRLRAWFVRVVNLLNARPSAILRSYSFGPGADITGLVWREGHVEHQDSRFEPEAVPGTFRVHYSLFAPGAVTLAVMPAAAPAATDKLMRLDLAFEVREGGGIGVDRREIAYVVQRQVRARLEFRPDYAHARVTLEARNLDGFGVRLYAIDPAALDATALTQLADFVVGTRQTPPPVLTLPPD